jgi:hypothetical protein
LEGETGKVGEEGEGEEEVLEELAQFNTVQVPKP